MMSGPNVAADASKTIAIIIIYYNFFSFAF